MRMLALAFCLGLMLCSGAIRADDTPASPATDDGPFALIVSFEIAPGREAQFKSRALAFARMAEAAVPGVMYRLHADPVRAGAFVFYEYFPSAAAYDKVQGEVADAHRAEHGPTPQGMFAKPPSERRWQPLN